MTSHNYPDNLYADALGVIRKHTGAPTGAYRSADPVTKPAHYQRAGIETIDYIRATLDGPGFEAYCIGNVLKYVSRYREKGGVEDLRKAQVYLGWAISPKGEASNPAAMREAKIAYNVATDEGVTPKWSPEWAKANSSLHWVNPEPQVVCAGSTTVSDGLQWNGPAPPNCDGHNPSGSTAPSGYVRWVERDTNPQPKSVGYQHPMQAEAIRDHDERLNGAEDRL